MSQEYTGADDFWHEPTSNDPHWTETSYWGFYVQERKLSGTIYNMWRKNLGLVSSRIWIWDDKADLAPDALYVRAFEHIVIPEDADPTHFVLPSGLECECIERLKSHRLRYADEDAVEFDLVSNAVHPPTAAFGSLESGTGHFDQHIRMSGFLRLWGEEIEVDCISMRDRSWSVRPDMGLPPMVAGYMHGAASPDECFLVMAVGDVNAVAKGEPQQIPAQSGYLIRDGKRAAIKGGTRTVLERHRGRPRRLGVEIEDDQGRTIRVQGECLNRFGAALNPSIWNWFSLFRWQFDNGAVGFGEDQETWIPPTSIRRSFASALDRC